MAGLYIPWPEKPECCLYCPCFDKHYSCNAQRRQVTAPEIYVHVPEWCKAVFISDDTLDHVPEGEQEPDLMRDIFGEPWDPPGAIPVDSSLS